MQGMRLPVAVTERSIKIKGSVISDYCALYMTGEQFRVSDYLQDRSHAFGVACGRVEHRRPFAESQRIRVPSELCEQPASGRQGVRQDQRIVIRFREPERVFRVFECPGVVAGGLERTHE